MSLAGFFMSSAGISISLEGIFLLPWQECPFRWRKSLFFCSGILAVSTLLKSQRGARPGSQDPPSQPGQSYQEAGPQASQVNQARTPNPQARPRPPGQPGQSCQDPPANRNSQQIWHNKGSFGCLMKPAAGATPRGE